MSGGTVNAAAIAAELDEAERHALQALAPGRWQTAPALAETTSLLRGHGVPLIAVMGDYAQPTRVGVEVLQQLPEPAQ